jgi:DNA repair exonuclease SbcCD ATPase subunit
MEIKELRNKLERQKGKRIEIENTVSTLQIDLQEKKRDLRRHEQAREIIKEVGQKTQEQLSVHISDITSLALESVFNDPYELLVEFVQRRNKTECDLKFVRDGNTLDPMKDSGVGATDVAAFALRIASWSMQIPHTVPVLLLDEPFKHLKGIEQNQRVLEMIKEISKRMGIQIITISDERIPREDIVEAADKVFEISIKNKISKVKVL